MNLYDVYSLFNVIPTHGRGAYVYDNNGKEYLDFYGGHAVISVGHTHPHYVRTISDQLNKIGFYSNSVINPLQQELADKLESTSGVNGFDLFLINSGAEANENAIKLASFFKGRKNIIALENSFHGRTSAAINVTHTGKKHMSPANQGIDVTYCDHRDVDTILRHIETSDFAAIIIEAIQGVGGLDMIGDSALRKIRTACDQTDTILIMDEVQCGYGRSGHFFAYQSSGITPDIITVAKGMGNGFPIGGVLINSIKMPAVKSRLGTTYGGNHLACAAGIAVLDIIVEEDLVSNALKMGKRLQENLTGLPHVKKLKGAGLMLGIEFDFAVKDFRKHMVLEHNIFTGSSSNPNLLRILPPLNISEIEIDLFLSKLYEGLNSI